MDQRLRSVTRVLLLVLGANLLVAGAKLLAGGRLGSIALAADGLHSLLDASSNVVGLIGTVAGARPPDDGHPYGHRRFEAAAAALIGVLIAGGMVAVGGSVVAALVEGRSAPEPNALSTLVVAATVATNLAVSHYEARAGRRLGSAVLEADAGHTFSDSLASMVVLASFAGSAVGLAWADIAAAAVVSLFIGRTAWRVLAVNLRTLTDAARLDPQALARVAASVSGVRGAHSIRSRGSVDHVHVDLHLELGPELPLEQAHRKTHEVADALRRAFPNVCDVVVHAEPATPGGGCAD